MDSHTPGNEDWIPADSLAKSESEDTEEPRVTKRRRPGRKRKRRPQNNGDRQHYDDIANSSADDITDGRLPSRSRPKRPQRLDQRDENTPWRDEMMAEEAYRPARNYNRRRLYPKYEDDEPRENGDRREFEDKRYKDENDDGKTSAEENVRRKPYYNDEEKVDDSTVERIRDPYTALNEETNRRRPYSKRKYNKNESDDTFATPASNPIDLKSLLKQSGGISLSELLQQRNLSLADLLKGEQHAISALTNIPEQTSEPYDKYMQNDESEHKYPGYNRRLPPVRKYQKQEDDQITTASENLLPRKNDIEFTTERRIFVPSHPKYYTSVDYKPNMNELNSIKTTSTSSSTTDQPQQTSESISIISSTVTFSTSENPTMINTKLKTRPRYTLPPTLAKLKTVKTTMKTIINTETENYPKLLPVPVKAIKIELNELFGMQKLSNNLPIPSSTEGPMKISVNIEEIIENLKFEHPNNKNSITSSNEKISFQDSTKESEKVKELTAKDEIMEILSDSVSRKNLTRLLELRNMTLDELVEQRERGSSQRHLADIFHNQTKEPEPTDEMVVDQIVKTNENSFLSPANLFETFPAFDLKPDNNNIQATHYTRESRENQLSSKETNDVLDKLIWRQAYTNDYKDKTQKYVLPDKFFEDDLVIKDEAQRIEDIENKLVEAVNGALNIDVANHKTYEDIVEDDESEFSRLPYGVRSAIIASAIIVGISILIFLTILIIFKLSQRQRKHLNYTNSFSSGKIRAPILETPYQRRIFSSIMNSTFGRTKRIPTISCAEPQSLQEYLWETDRKPFQ